MKFTPVFRAKDGQELIIINDPKFIQPGTGEAEAVGLAAGAIIDASVEFIGKVAPVSDDGAWEGASDGQVTIGAQTYLKLQN